MEPRPAALGIVLPDMAASLAFYRRLGLDIPADAGHVDIPFGGMRLAWDTEASFAPSTPTGPRRTGDRLGLNFLCDSPAASTRSTRS